MSVQPALVWCRPGETSQPISFQIIQRPDGSILPDIGHTPIGDKGRRLMDDSNGLEWVYTTSGDVVCGRCLSQTHGHLPCLCWDELEYDRKLSDLLTVGRLETS